MDRPIRDQAIVALVAAIVMFAALGSARLWDRDEPRNAGCAAEMIERGDWVVPWFNGELRGHKPVLLYWLMMASYGLFGVNEFAARLPSALLGVGTALLAYHLGRRLFCRRVGLLAGIILATSLNFDVAARAATPDATLIFFSTLALWCFVAGAFPRLNDDQPAPVEVRPHAPQFTPTRIGYFLAMYAAMGAAALAKGPIGVLLPTAVIGLFLLYVRLPKREQLAGAGWDDWIVVRLRPFHPAHIARCAWSMRPITLLLVVAATALPWYVLVHVRTDGAWTREFFITHNVERATDAMEGHKGPFFYYIIAILIGFFPWSIFAAPALIGWRRRARGRHPWSAGYTLLATWTAAYVVLFSLVQTKLPSYVLPVYPALALATACFLHSWIEQTAEAAAWWMRYAFVLLATVGVALLIGLPIASRFIAQLDGELGLLGVIPLAAAAVCWRSSESGARERTVGAMALAAVLLAVCVFVAGVPRVDRHQTSEPLVDAIRRIGGPEAKIAAYRDLEPSFVFYAGRPIPIDYEPRQIEATLRDPNAYVILHPENLEAIQAHVPADVHVVARLPRFMKEGEIVVLGRDSRPGQSPRQAAIESANPPR